MPRCHLRTGGSSVPERRPRLAAAARMLQTSSSMVMPHARRATTSGCRGVSSTSPSNRTPLGLLVRPVLGHVGWVDAHEVNRARAKLALYVADVFASVPRKDQRAKGDCYLRGLMLDGRRKSIQAMAGRLPDGNDHVLADRLSPTQPPLRTPPPQLPGLSRPRRSPLLLQTTHPPHHIGHGLRYL